MTPYPLYDLVKWFFAPVFKKTTAGKLYVYGTAEVMEWPKYIADEITKYSVPSWPSHLFYEWDMRDVNGVFHRLFITWLYKDLKLDDYENRLPLPDLQLDSGTYRVNPTYSPLKPDSTYWAKTIVQWQDDFMNRLRTLIENEPMTRQQFMDVIGSMGAVLYREEPDSFAARNLDRYVKEMDAFLQKVENWQRALDVVKIFAIADLFTSVDTGNEDIKKAQDALDKAKDELLNPEAAVDTAVQVASDTVEDQLNDMRKDLLDYIREIDDQTFLNLSAVEQAAAGATRDAIDAITDSTESIAMALIHGIDSIINGAEQDLQEPSAQVRIAQEEIQMSGGVGLALGLKRLLFRRKE